MHAWVCYGCVYIQIHVCVCEEFLYYGVNKDLTSCLKCRGIFLTISSITTMACINTSILNVSWFIRKVLRYFPITDRLKQLFNHPIYSHFFTYDQHNIQKRNNDNNYDKDVMEDIHHAPIWKEFMDDLPTYNEKGAAGECDKRVAFIMTADSASMSSFNAADFSLTPFILSILNWPINIRTKRNHLLYTIITPINNKQTSIYFRKLHT